MRLRKIIAFSIALVLLMLTLPAFAEEMTMYADNNSVQVYKTASTSGKKYGKLNFGESVTMVRKKKGWAEIKNDTGKIGYCKASLLTPSNPNGTPVSWYAKKDGATVYKKVSTSSKVLGSIKKGEAIAVIATTKDKNWKRVEFDGGYGYVKVSQLTESAPVPETTVYIRSNTVKFYAAASSSSKRLGILSFGADLTRIKVKGTWAKVRNASGQTGWCKNSALTETNPNSDAETLYVSAEKATVYVRPVTTSKQLKTLEKGDDVSAVAESTDGTWKRVAVQSNYGYIKCELLSADNPNEPDPDTPNPGYTDPYKGTANAKIEKIVALAIQQYGKPYIYAEEGPDAYDCSGLTCYVFLKAAGISLKRSAYDQGYDKRFERLDVNSLRRGDTVYFNTVEGDPDLSDHAGLYIGGGLFIHASSGQMKVVVNDLKSGYYQRAFSWGLRIIK